MPRYIAIFTALFVWTLAGCAGGPPTAEQIAAADYGSPISQADAQAKATSYLKTTLKDPSSAQIDWDKVDKGWMRDAAIQGGQLYYGYKLDANVNAKNSFGGYVGYRKYMFLFQNGNLAHVYGEDVLEGGTKYMAKLK